MNKYYEPWVAAGEKWKNAPVLEEFVNLVKHYHANATVWTLGNKEHLTADRPQDHTPYSVTGWPKPATHGLVYATDIENIAHLDALAMRIINDCRAGRCKAIHYINFNHQNYSADRNNFRDPEYSADGGWIHISFRTDVDSLNGWNPFASPVSSSHYTVQHGDTLYGIAHDAKTTVGKLLSLNKAHLDEVARQHGEKDSHQGNLIYPGTVLDMP